MTAGNQHYNIGHFPWDQENCEGHLQTRGTARELPGACLVVGREKTHKRVCSVVSSGSSHELGSVSLCRAISLKFG